MTGREHVPSVAFTRTEDVSSLIKYPELTHVLEDNSLNRLAIDSGNLNAVIPSTTESSVAILSETIDVMTTIVPQFRKFLLPSSPFRMQATEHLDAYCEHLRALLPSMTLRDKLELVGSFGQLQEYSVSNRVSARYNVGKLVYHNSVFFNSLVDSINFSSLRTITHRIVPLMDLVRSVSRMDLVSGKMHAILIPMISSLVPSLTPKFFAELILITSKNKFVHLELFEAAIEEMDLNFRGFAPDLLGDISRGFTNVGFISERMISILNRELVPHQLSWWNLIDILDYYRLNKVDHRITILMANEVWKWIPDMRSGYVAKSVRVLAQMNLGDSRTRRSLIRAIPKGLNKLYPHHVAECIIAAAEMNYLPKKKYGRKKFGSLFYRRMASKLSQSLEKVDPQLLVDVVKALAKLGRVNNELFDAILSEKTRFSIDQIAAIEKVLGDKFLRPTDPLAIQMDISFANIDTLLYLARSDSELLSHLIHTREEDMLRMNIDDMVGLLKTGNILFSEWATNQWLFMNLTKISSLEVCMYLKNIVTLKPEIFKLIAIRVNKDPSIELIASFLTVSDYAFTELDETVFDLIRDQAVDNLIHIQLAQFISAHSRLGVNKITEPLFRFCQWIDTHLVSKNGPVQSSNLQWHVPPGCVTDLNVFPVVIPLALPDPRMDLRTLQTATNVTEVRRALGKNSNDCGIALFPHFGHSKDLVTTMREQYLTKLGWTVKYTANDTTNSTVVTNALIIDTETSISI